MKGNSRRSVQLGDLFTIKHGYAFKGEHFGSEGSHIVLTPGNFFDEGGFKKKGEKEKWYSGKIPEEYILSQGDLLVAMTEQAEGLLGSAALVPENSLYLHNQRLGLIQNLNGVEKRFLYFLFNSQPVRQHIRANCSGVKVRHTSPSRIYEVKVDIPPLPTQRKIAAILSAYNDLIENNLRRIKILEEMAQNLYREWFVKLRFPGHGNARFVDSPLGRIPEGWEVRTVRDLVERRKPGKLFSQKTASPEGEVPILDQGRSGIIGYHNYEPGIHASEANPVIVFANHTCYQRMVQYPFSAIQNVLPYVPSEKYKRNIYWLHWATKDLVEFNDYKGHWPEFMSKELVLPNRALCEVFGEKAESIVKLIYRLEKSNQSLCQTRDLLLTRLISGELDVSELGIDIGNLTVQAGAESPEIRSTDTTSKKKVKIETAPLPQPQKEAIVKTPEPETPDKIPAPIDEWETNEVMAVFRSFVRSKGFIERDQFIRLVAHEMGYKRVSSRIYSILKGHIIAAIRRDILETETGWVRIKTNTIEEYHPNDLIRALWSVLPKNRYSSREDTMRAAAEHLGFRRLTERARMNIKAAMRVAIRRGILKGDKEDIWRAD